ncbi:PadR family transcriptional regulator [Cytophagaceae bacterium DM2B3-1]|uniref:PadR family transcriptional regulator n=2 Tax=Xanthocytophaga TaxID=3078918 RepID=A0AAE3UB79_9BACT|nr:MULTISPECIES: PadR family transcriptional regulator [Xanthocytophaga]MDJ1467223.1 PadR family transcriptional regulator [Xanthocytophaga flavus]MDJ1485507.1 PadR family transcriptional regulator [Xanthocytophaga flavus]MDJ1495300.1 PadR family transcriptional regulator [Xanthocytophaga flavus]MDJ1503037.1 PadR family transcriptional regulator [Xanthocytophaga agilis]
MRRTYLGELEEMILLMVAILDGEAYGVTVSQQLEQHTGRQLTFGTVHNTLIRLEEKGFVASHLGGATTERGGRRKRFFTLTALGSRALQDVQELRNQLWQMVPPHALQVNGL